MKSKFILCTAVPVNSYNRLTDPLIIDSIGNVDLDVSGKRTPSTYSGLNLYGWTEDKKMGALIDGTLQYQTSLITGIKFKIAPLGFWFLNPNTCYESLVSYVLMVPTYDSHHKLNLARFY